MGTRQGRAEGRILPLALQCIALCCAHCAHCFAHCCGAPTDSSPDVEKFSMVLNLSAAQWLLLVKIIQNCILSGSSPLIMVPHKTRYIYLLLEISNALFWYIWWFESAHLHQHCQHYDQKLPVQFTWRQIEQSLVEKVINFGEI